jgi:hypothetical protein
MDFALVRVVAMPPQHELLQQKERQNSDEERPERMRGRDGFESLGEERRRS